MRSLTLALGFISFIFLMLSLESAIYLVQFSVFRPRFPGLNAQLIYSFGNSDTCYGSGSLVLTSLPSLLVQAHLLTSKSWTSFLRTYLKLYWLSSIIWLSKLSVSVVSLYSSTRIMFWSVRGIFLAYSLMFYASSSYTCSTAYCVTFFAAFYSLLRGFLIGIYSEFRRKPTFLPTLIIFLKSSTHVVWLTSEFTGENLNGGASVTCLSNGSCCCCFWFIYSRISLNPLKINLNEV